MRKLSLALLLAAVPAFARPHPGPAIARQADRSTPRSIGQWGDWQAFAAPEAGSAVCYALSRPFSSVPAVVGAGEPGLTVARWPGRGGAVSLAPGRAGLGGAAVELRVGSELFVFDAAPDGASSARDAAAAVAAMQRGLQAVARFAMPGGARATDTYSLRGFRAAYGAMRRACPGR